MKTLSRYSAAPLSLAILTAFPPAPVASRALAAGGAPQNTAQQFGALERGYRTGYSDGYQAGYRDSADSAPRNFSNKEDYQRGDRAYAASYGALEDYRDGYQQGFEAGYGAGYDRRTFDSSTPANLSRRGVASNSGGNTSADDSSGVSGGTNTTAANVPATSAPTGSMPVVFIPADTVMRVELLTNLSTDATQRGDRFQARVLEPREYEGAILDGRVTRVKAAGKVKGNAELQLSFEQIRLPDNRFAGINAQVIEVLPGGGTGVGEVDTEGGVRGKDKTKDDVSTVSASTGIGAIIGAIAGGGKGAAIGAAIGGAVGTGRVLSSRGSNITLTNGQQLRVRTVTETRVQ